MRRSPADALAACRIRFLLPWVLALSAAGCAGAGDAGRLEAFAEAGIAYADKAPTLMDRSFEAALERGVRDLGRAAGRLHRIKAHLKAVTALLKTVGRVVELP